MTAPIPKRKECATTVINQAIKEMIVLNLNENVAGVISEAITIIILLVPLKVQKLSNLVAVSVKVVSTAIKKAIRKKTAQNYKKNKKNLFNQNQKKHHSELVVKEKTKKFTKYLRFP